MDSQEKPDNPASRDRLAKLRRDQHNRDHPVHQVEHRNYDFDANICTICIFVQQDQTDSPEGPESQASLASRATPEGRDPRETTEAREAQETREAPVHRAKGQRRAMVEDAVSEKIEFFG